MQYLGQRSSLLQALKVDNNLTIQLPNHKTGTICLLNEFDTIELVVLECKSQKFTIQGIYWKFRDIGLSLESLKENVLYVEG